jgi:hypothetical protein
MRVGLLMYQIKNIKKGTNMTSIKLNLKIKSNKKFKI